MKAKIHQFLESRLPVAIIFLALGVLLIGMPVATLNVITKVIFGLVLILAGVLNVISQARSDSNAGLIHLYTGVITIIVGIFLFTNPQIIVRLLPYILGGFLLADCIWILKDILFLRKNGGSDWEAFSIAVIAFIILAVLVMINPFGQIRKELVFTGWVFALKGLLDIIISIFVNKQKKRLLAPRQPGYSVVPANKEKKKFHLPILHGKDKKKDKKEDVSDQIIDVEPQSIDEDVIYSGGAQQTYQQDAYQQQADPYYGQAGAGYNDTSAQQTAADPAYTEEAASGSAAYNEADYDSAFDQNPGYDASYADPAQNSSYDGTVPTQDAGMDNSGFGGSTQQPGYDEPASDDSWVEE